MTRRIKFWIAWYVPLVGLWLAFVSTLDRNEVLLGLLAAALGATAQELVNAQDLVRFRLEPRWLRDLRLLPWPMVRDSWRLTVVLWRQLARGHAVAGSFRTLPYPVAPEDDARANARKALITAAVSVTPNTYVVGIEGDDNQMLVHQLVPDADDPIPPSMLARAGQSPPPGDRREGS
jgi:multisubunit Na+/H+ antiporter MnhE subunit